MGNESQFIWSLIWVIVGIYVLVFLKITWMINWLTEIDKNFLLFVFTPLVIVAIRHYKNLIFWGYDLVRPIGRKRYFQDQIAGVLIHLLQYWVMVVVVMGLVPARLFLPAPFVTPELAGYFCLSGSLLFLMVAVLVFLTATEDNVSIFVHGGMVSVAILLFYEPTSYLTVKGYILSCLVCLAGGLIYIQRGYHAWCRKEYV